MKKENNVLYVLRLAVTLLVIAGVMAAALAGVATEECTMFDDSVAACRGAKAAGMQVVGVYDSYFDMTVDEMQQVCDRYIRSFEELT